MSNDDRNAVSCSDRKDRAHESLVTLWIEIGIWLVKHQEDRVAIKCARKRDARTLTLRKRATVLTDIRVIPIGQFEVAVNAGKCNDLATVLGSFASEGSPLHG